MSTVTESNVCSMCKHLRKTFCIGCQKYFCPNHFKEHEQKLSITFDNEIIRSHDEILDGIQRLEQSNSLPSGLIDKIEQWKRATIHKVEKAVEQAQHQLIELINRQRTTIAEELEPITKEIRYRREEENFLETDIDLLKQKINEIQQKLERFLRNDTNNAVIFNIPLLTSINLLANTKWKQNGVVVAGGNSFGININQLCNPWGFRIDDAQTVYIADCGNHRIVEWKCNAMMSQIVAGGNGEGQGTNQFYWPTDVIIDKKTDSLIICDYGNKRVVRWPRQRSTSGEVIISNIACYGLTIDNDGFLYLVDSDKHEVKRYRIGENDGTIVAGGNGRGNRFDQLHYPRYTFVDRNQTVYVSDECNHRIMKWTKGAKQGIVVAGGLGEGNSLTQLSNPCGIVVDQSDNVYVVDAGNHRIMRWCRGETQGNIIAGGNGKGNQSNQFSRPTNLSFDREGNLYVSESENHRVQKFNIDRS
ncbi:unnamed protein product [Rotaria magnacalcarata]|uniref:Uncharacterized protein n=3 Tax=Rotaria magnacalcarata TaxID=392030 RepID=A0A816XVN4_9BILA|nr:unnamed protein product [Rotaria magnacalcarata]